MLVEAKPEARQQTMQWDEIEIEEESLLRQSVLKTGVNCGPCNPSKWEADI